MAAGDNQQENTASGTLMSADTALDQQQIRQMQGLLRAMDYDITSIDGLAGPETEAALQKFLQDNNFATDGGMDQESLMLVKAEAGQSASIEQKLTQTRQQMQEGAEAASIDILAMQYALQAKGFSPEIDGHAGSDFNSSLNNFADYLKYASGDHINRTANPGQRILELNNNIREIETRQSEIIADNNLPLTLTGIGNSQKINELYEQTEERLRSTLSPDFNETDANGNPVDPLEARAEANNTLTALMQLRTLESDRYELVGARHNILHEENRNVQLSVSETDWKRMHGHQLVDATIIDAGIQLTQAEYQEVRRASLQYAVEGDNVPNGEEIADFYIDKFASHLDEADQARLHESIEKYESIEVTRDEIDTMRNRQIDDVIERNRDFMIDNEVIDADGNVLNERRYNQLIGPRISDSQSLEEEIRHRKFSSEYPDEKTPGELSRELGAPNYDRYSGNAEIGAAARKSIQAIRDERQATAEAYTQPASAGAAADTAENTNQDTEIPAGSIDVEVSSGAFQDDELNTTDQKILHAGQTIRDAAEIDGGKISLADSVIASEVALNENGIPNDLDIERVKGLSEEMGYDINHKYDVSNPAEFSDLQRANFAYSAEIPVSDIPDEINSSIENASYELNGIEAPSATTDADPAAPETQNLTEEELRAQEIKRLAEDVNNRLPTMNSL